jgi:sialic acid synthase SpsE
LKSIVAKRRIQEGEELSVDNLTVKRAEKGISASYWNLILGKRATKNYDVDEPIQIR